MLTNEALKAYAQPVQNKRIRLELLNFDFSVVDSIEGVCIGGSLQKVADEPLRRSGSITLAVPIDRSATTFLDAVGGYTISFGGKIWLDKYIKIYIGIDSMEPPYKTAWQTFGYCLIDEPVRDFSAEQYQISFSVIDLMARLTGLRFGQLTAISTVIEAGVQSGDTYTPTETRSALEAVITELGGITNYAIYPLPQKYKYLPYDIKVDVGATVWDIISQFMDILAGWQIYFDDEGVLRVEPIPSGVHGISYPLKYESLISAKVSTDFQEVKNQVIVYGRTLEPSFTATSGTTVGNLTINCPSADASQFTIGATILAFRFLAAADLPQTSTFTLNDSIGSFTCNLVDYANNTPYVPQTRIFQDSYYCVRLYSATLLNDGSVDTSQPMTWEWLGKQQVSACRVDDNRESPFYINNQYPNSYWCGFCSPVAAFAYTVYEAYIDDQSDLITALPDKTILTLMVTNANLAGQQISVFSSNGTGLLSRIPIYFNGAAITNAKMVEDYTIFVLQYNETNNRFDLLGRHPYVLTKVLSGGVYDNIFADMLADERAQYELFLASSMQNNISLAVVPTYALDVNTKIPFSDNWAMPYDLAQTVEEETKNYIVKQITYPLDFGTTPQEIQAVIVYDNENLVGQDYEVPNDTAPQLATPTATVDSNMILTVTGSPGATHIKITANPEVGDTSEYIIQGLSANLKQYLLPDVVYHIQVRTIAYGYEMSEAYTLYYVSYSAAKGDIISMNVDGTEKQFRVIKRSGDVAEVVAMFATNDNVAFSSTSRTYEGGELDVALNTTWYGTLNAVAKAAIVDKTIQQELWYPNDAGSPTYPVYNGYYGTTAPGTTPYTLSIYLPNFASEITRHVYAPSIQDILDYVLDATLTDGQLQNYNIWKMMWNTSNQPANGSSQTFWLRDAVLLSACGLLSGSDGRISFTRYTYGRSVRPAFQIDLTKISYKVIV